MAEAIDARQHYRESQFSVGERVTIVDPPVRRYEWMKPLVGRHGIVREVDVRENGTSYLIERAIHTPLWFAEKCLAPYENEDENEEKEES